MLTVDPEGGAGVSEHSWAAGSLSVARHESPGDACEQTQVSTLSGSVACWVWDPCDPFALMAMNK